MGKKKPGYLSLEEAIKAVKKMKPKSFVDYRARRSEYPGLPCSPGNFYGESYPGWDVYTSGSSTFYPTVEEAKAAVSKLGIESFPQYKVRRHEDHRLPLHPKAFYGARYKGHADFYGKVKAFYPTVAQASDAAIALGVRTSREYAEKFAQDSSLPAHPNRFYKEMWPGWPAFLQHAARKKGQGRYESLSEFTAAVRKLGIQNQKDYVQKYRQDPKLPGNPREIYEREWPGWGVICGVNPRLNKCDTWQEAKQVAAQYWFTSRTDYMGRCSIDPRLPKYPSTRYKDFPGWETYLFPDQFRCLNDFKCALRQLNVQSVKRFEEVLALYPSIPRNPMQDFKEEWVSWEDAFGLRNFYSFAELSEIAQANGCKTMKEYRSLVRSLKDPRMPSSPHYVYKEWENAHKFFSKVEPYTLEFVESDLKGWIPSIKSWLVGVRAAVHKESSLCRFLRHFVSPYRLGCTPHEFLLKSGIDVKPFISLLEQQVSDKVGRNLLRHVNEFLNHILKTELTVEDEDTGEKIRVHNASNPLAYLEHSVTDSQRPGESVKPALAYQYVERIKKWIVPETAKNFSDLPHIQVFDSDYVEVEESIIDRQDPDCVFRERDGKIYIWCPVHWMHTYALVSIPARGRQIAYNDSGEADEYIADIENDKIAWVKNTGSLAGWRPASATSGRKNTPAKGFMQHDDKGWVMNFTSNKTGFNGSGYKVDWAPEALIYWMVRLRKWQEKYNPISRPLPWTECTRTLLNVAQLKAKGANCFLFRGFREEEPPAYSARSTDRLAAALYYSQPKDVVLATFLEGGSRGTLSRYDSKYTPHSMRVSLITAYVMEFGLPIEIVMKLAGHSSMVMSIYYVKVGGVTMRRRMEEGEKLALQQESYAVQDMIEQGRLDGLRHQLVASSEQALEMLRSGYAGSNLVRDYGLCPYAAGRCEDGGPLVGATQIRLHAPSGYLGMQNCPRCRHFITGPMFLGGLLSLWNEISLRMTFLSEHYHDFEAQVSNLELQVQKFDEEQYDIEQAGGKFDEKPRKRASMEIRKLQSELESTAKKMDMFLCDIQALSKHVSDCRELISKKANTSQGSADELMLVAHEQHEVITDIENTSLFQQLHEVCVNATIYQSATAEFAVPRRSLMLDKMALMNDLRPAMCNLTDKEQLVLGNQVTKFLFNRVKSWERVDRLMEGTLKLADLTGAERIDKAEIQQLLESKPMPLGPLGRVSSSADDPNSRGSTLIYGSGLDQTSMQDVRYPETYEDKGIEPQPEDEAK